MSLPPGFLDELRNRLSLASVVGRKVIWDNRKSNPGKGDMWAPCPFHQEKTASFHVDDRKGFYYCFGCHAKGDAIGFVRETENVSFMEAVEILAREAGMPVPKRDPRAQKQADRRSELAEVMEQAARFYRMLFATGRAAGARDYIDGRGLSAQTQERFEIGFAPKDRTALLSALKSKGVAEKDMIDAGLVIAPDSGTPYDRFRGRIMFPIRDARGRCIAFGGRAMDPDARAKYLNSNETLLFDKGRSLYNHGPAREASGKVSSLIVAEGYMDVIALVQAGFDHAVAPLGTAITEGQLQLLWRMCPEPIITLDGDEAGQRAALRLIDLALPLLEPGKSLRFCMMPAGQDPDDLIRAKGTAAMQAALDAAQPMVNLLWARETEGHDFDSPERRAALDQRLRDAIKTIKDPSIRSHYGQAIRDLRAELFAPRRAAAWQPRAKRKAPASSGARQSALASDSAQPVLIREAIILMAALRNPKAAADMEGMLEKCHLSRPEHQEIRNRLLASLGSALSADQSEGALAAQVSASLGYDVDKWLRDLPQVASHPLLRIGASPEATAQVLREELVKHAAITGAAVELADAAQDLAGFADEGVTWRIQQATRARDAARKSALDGGGTDGEDRQELSHSLQKLIDDQVWVKKKR